MDLLHLSKSLPPHLRSAFAESMIERGLIDCISAALRGQAERAKRLQGQDVGEEENEKKERVEGAQGGGRRLRPSPLLRSSVRCCRWLFPLSLSVLSSLLLHCPESFRSYYMESRLLAPRTSLLSSLLTILALPSHVDATIAQQSLAFMRTLIEGEEEEGGGVRGVRGEEEVMDGSAQSLRSILLTDDMAGEVAASLRLLSVHPRPHLARLSSSALLEWLTLSLQKVDPSQAVPFLTHHRLPSIAATFLSRSKEVEDSQGATTWKFLPTPSQTPLPLSPTPLPPPLPTPSSVPLLSLPCHPPEVLCGAVRLLCVLVSCHGKVVCADTAMSCDVLPSALRWLSSPLCRSNLLHSTLLEFLTALLNQADHVLPLLRQIQRLTTSPFSPLHPTIHPLPSIFTDLQRRLKTEDREQEGWEKEGKEQRDGGGREEEEKREEEEEGVRGGGGGGGEGGVNGVFSSLRWSQRKRKALSSLFPPSSPTPSPQLPQGRALMWGPHSFSSSSSSSRASPTSSSFPFIREGAQQSRLLRVVDEAYDDPLEEGEEEDRGEDGKTTAEELKGEGEKEEGGMEGVGGKPSVGDAALGRLQRQERHRHRRWREEVTQHHNTSPPPSQPFRLGLPSSPPYSPFLCLVPCVCCL